MSPPRRRSNALRSEPSGSPPSAVSSRKSWPVLWPSRWRSARRISASTRDSARSGRRKRRATQVSGAQTSQTPQGCAGVLLVAEVAHQVEHPAAVGLGEAHHLVELRQLVVALGEVGTLASRPRPGRTLPSASTSAPPWIQSFSSAFSKSSSSISSLLRGPCRSGWGSALESRRRSARGRSSPG